MEERYVSLAGDRLCKQGLAGARHAYEQDSLGYARAHLYEFLRILEVVDHFEQLVLGFLLAGHVGECRLLVVFLVALGAALAETESLVVALRLLEDHPDDEEAEYPREELAEQP
jgi:hypothetical protein